MISRSKIDHQVPNPIENYFYWNYVTYHGWFQKLIAARINDEILCDRLPKARDEVEILWHQMIQERAKNDK